MPPSARPRALTILVDTFYDDARRDPLLGPVYCMPGASSGRLENPFFR